MRSVGSRLHTHVSHVASGLTAQLRSHPTRSGRGEHSRGRSSYSVVSSCSDRPTVFIQLLAVPCKVASAHAIGSGSAVDMASPSSSMAAPDDVPARKDGGATGEGAAHCAAKSCNGSDGAPATMAW